MLELNLMCVDFNSDDNIPLGLQRSISKGETNRYRIKSNHFYCAYDNPLEFEIHIVKECCDYGSQSEMMFSKSEVRKITRWLTSTSLPLLLNGVDDEGAINYCGIFTNIESFVVGGEIYGFILKFTNDSPFAYSDVITQNETLNGTKNIVVDNDSDLLDDYCKPVLKIHPHTNTDFYVCNLSDCKTLKEGQINIVPDDKNATQINFIDAINDYATTTMHDIGFYYNGAFVKTWADGTAIRIKLTEKDSTEHFAFAYHLSDGSFKIIEGGFMTLKLLKELEVEVNCDILSMKDSIGRMIKFADMGIEEEDYIYWLRLISGDNTLLFYGKNCDVTIEHREMLKVGAA